MKHHLLAGCLLACLSSTYAAEVLVVDANIARLDYQLRDTQTPQANAASATSATTPAVPAAQESVPIRVAEPVIAPPPQAAAPATVTAGHKDLWSRVRAGFAMPALDTPLTRKWELYYASRPEYLNRIFDRGNRYLYHVVDEVEKRGIPMEIALLPMIESAYNPKAESPARAAGMWQFIPSTGKHYGLERTWWYDGRRDVVAATSAALNYLTDIHGLFGNWQLALASYNWGENAVGRAVAKRKAANLSAEYVDLKMPAETANYVPKLMAVRNIIANPEAYGIKLTDLPNRPYFTAIDNKKHMDVKIAAQLAEIPVSELLHLNPGFIRPVIAQKDDRKLVLPVDKVDAFQRNLASYDKPLLTWQPYVTRPGEAFDKLARQFGISASELKDVNDIALKDNAAHGQTILVPKADQLDISDRQTLAALAANRNADPVDRGEKDAPRAAEINRIYKVAKGDTLFSIARQNNITPEQLRTLNDIKGNAIKAGDTLKLGNIQTASAKTGKPAQRDTREYVAQRGDTVAAVAKKFNVAAVDLAKWNNLGKKGLQPGSKIVIY